MIEARHLHDVWKPNAYHAPFDAQPGLAYGCIGLQVHRATVVVHVVTRDAQLIGANQARHGQEQQAE